MAHAELLYPLAAAIAYFLRADLHEINPSLGFPISSFKFSFLSIPLLSRQRLPEDSFCPGTLVHAARQIDPFANQP